MEGEQEQADVTDVAKEQGADLDAYVKEIEQQRNSRTLLLRRVKRPQLTDLAARNHLKARLESIKKTRLDTAAAIVTLRTGTEAQINELCHTITKLASAEPESLHDFITSEDACTAYQTCLKEATAESVIVNLLYSMAVVFPLYGSMMNTFVDGEICYNLIELINSPSYAIVSASIGLINAMTRASGYGRDGILCCGLHDALIGIAAREETDENLSAAACRALSTIFGNPEQIEHEVIVGCVDAAAELIHLKSQVALRSVLDFLCSLSNKMPTIVSVLCGHGIHVSVLRLLDGGELCDAALNLVGNLAVGDPKNVKEMLDAGLLGHLDKLMGTEHTSAVLWIQSNLVETVPNEFLKRVTRELVDQILEIADSSGSDILRECGYFLATLIVFMGWDLLPVLVTTPVLAILIDLLECGVPSVVLRCLDALLRSTQYVQTAGLIGQFASIIGQSNVSQKLDDLMDDNVSDVSQRALALQNRLMVLSK
jgi:hypothetical protein